MFPRGTGQQGRAQRLPGRNHHDSFGQIKMAIRTDPQWLDGLSRPRAHWITRMGRWLLTLAGRKLERRELSGRPLRR